MQVLKTTAAGTAEYCRKLGFWSDLHAARSGNKPASVIASFAARAFKRQPLIGEGVIPNALGLPFVGRLRAIIFRDWDRNRDFLESEGIEFEAVDLPREVVWRS